MSGLKMIKRERARQRSDEGWSEEHDDQHNAGELYFAGTCYMLAADAEAKPPRAWPWDSTWWKPKGRDRNLVRAGALFAAEIERLERKLARVTTMGFAARRTTRDRIEELKAYVDRAASDIDALGAVGV